MTKHVKGVVVGIGLVAIVISCGGALKGSESRPIMLWGRRIAAEDVVSILLSGPSVTSEVYTWTRDEAELRQYKGDLGNRIIALYTNQNTLVLKWNLWPKEGDDKHLDTCTLINLDEVSYVNIINRQDGKYSLRIEM
jgi:hypothetical protein